MAALKPACLSLNPDFSPINCVALDRLVNLSVSQVLICKMETLQVPISLE